MSEPAYPTEPDDLDFSRPSPRPLPQPTPEQVKHAREEASEGVPQLKKAGYFVSIARQAASRVAPRSGAKYALLVIEDDPDLGQLLIEIFTLAGFEVRWASNRSEINTEMKRQPGVDLVLLDIVLPDANGLQILQRIRSHPKLSALPVIMMTGKSEPEDVVAGLAAGADGYVSKPFQMSGMVKAVKSVLGVR